jgi:hypothetical protein
VKFGILVINKIYRISTINEIIGFIEILSLINFSLTQEPSAKNGLQQRQALGKDVLGKLGPLGHSGHSRQVLALGKVFLDLVFIHFFK